MFVLCVMGMWHTPPYTRACRLSICFYQLASQPFFLLFFGRSSQRSRVDDASCVVAGRESRQPWKEPDAPSRVRWQPETMHKNERDRERERESAR